MKTFRFIEMALLAVVMCVASCSSDDEEDNSIKNDDGIVTNQKKLMEIKMVDDNGESIITEYSYGSNEKLLSATRTELYDGKENIRTYTITWGTNKIIENKDGRAITYTFEDGLITHTSDNKGGDLGNAALTYNSNKQLIKCQEIDIITNYIYTQSYIWQGEKLTKLIENVTANYNQYSEEYIDEYTYSGKTCKGYLPIMVWNVDDLRPLLEAHPELVGMRCNQLPDQISYKNDSYETIEKYTYTFDKDGYIESCTEESTYKHLDINETRTETTVYTFTWE